MLLLADERIPVRDPAALFVGAGTVAMGGALVGAFAALTIFMAYSMTGLKIETGFKKQLPLKHEYMQTFLQYEKEFGGANRILVALSARDGDMFDAEFFASFEEMTDQVFFIPGVDRASVRSIFTPNVRFVEIVEDDREKFLHFLEEHVHGQMDITSVETMTGLRNYKNQFLLKHNWS